MKLIKSLERKRILLKGITRKTSSEEGGFLNFLRTLMTAGLPLMKSVLTPLTKKVLSPFGLSAEMSAVDAAIQKKIYESRTTALLSNDKIDDIMKIVESLESRLIIKQIIS